MDYNFTARIEAEFDEVASGKIEWNNMIDDFYIPFKKDVENTIEKAERISGERELGVDPVSGKKLIVRMGRYGPMAQIGEQNDEEKPRFAKLKNTQSIETINLEDALELFKLPRNLGSFEGSDVTVVSADLVLILHTIKNSIHWEKNLILIPSALMKQLP